MKLTPLAALLLAALVYWSGLSGGFVLDDTPNLNLIDRLPPDPAWSDYWYLATSGLAGELGRPLSLLSFLLQSGQWPDPYYFKLVNLVLHLLNGGLILLCCRLIGTVHPRYRLPILPAAIVMFIWLVHPMQASTVLYVVQRMTQLSATFVLAGIALYLYGRIRLPHSPGPGAALMVAGPYAGGLLAVLCKENGVLVFLYLSVLELTLLQGVPGPPHLLRLRRVTAYGPALAGMGLAVLLLPQLLEGYALKPFTLGERTLTQIPVLLSYVAAMALVKTDRFGVFNDDFPILDGVLQVALLLPLLILFGAVLVWLLRRREQWPLLSFAVLWFVAGHALESTVLPLELYFEHRNYLPLFGPVFALVAWLTRRLPRLDVFPRRGAYAVAVAALCWMSLLGVQQSRLWGDALDQGYAAVAQHPQSVRAQGNLVLALTNGGRPVDAFEYHLTTLEQNPDRIAPYIRWLEFNCLLNGIPLPDFDALGARARTAAHDYGAVFTLNNLVMGTVQGRCPNSPITHVMILLENLIDNPSYEISRPDLLQLNGFLHAYQSDFSTAADLAARSFRERPDVRVALYRITWLLRAEREDEAGVLLDEVREEYPRDISRSSDLTARVAFLERQLR